MKNNKDFDPFSSKRLKFYKSEENARVDFITFSNYARKVKIGFYYNFIISYSLITFSFFKFSLILNF